MSKFQYVCKEIDKSRQFFREKRNYNRSRVFWLSVATTGFSAIASLAIGATKLAPAQYADALQLLALAVTALATIVGVWESVFSFRKLWNLNNVATAALDDLKRRMDYRLADGTPLSDAECDALFNEFNEINIKADRGWIDTYAAK